MPTAARKLRASGSPPRSSEMQEGRELRGVPMTIGTHFKYCWAEPPSILPSSPPSREPRPPSRKRGIGRRYNKLGKLAKVHQACAAARLRLKGEFSTLFEAATACGVCTACVQAMTTVLQADDPLLLLDVLAGRVPGQAHRAHASE